MMQNLGAWNPHVRAVEARDIFSSIYKHAYAQVILSYCKYHLSYLPGETNGCKAIMIGNDPIYMKTSSPDSYLLKFTSPSSNIIQLSNGY